MVSGGGVGVCNLYLYGFRWWSGLFIWFQEVEWGYVTYIDMVSDGGVGYSYGFRRWSGGM